MTGLSPFLSLCFNFLFFFPSYDLMFLAGEPSFKNDQMSKLLTQEPRLATKYGNIFYSTINLDLLKSSTLTANITATFSHYARWLSAKLK